MKKVLPILVAVIIIIAVVAWLVVQNNNTKTPATTGSMSMPSSSQKANNSTAQATDKVTIQNFAFSPAHITVKKDTTVTWTNMDNVAHTVTETDGQAGPKSGDVAQGQTYAFTFTTVGTFKYACSIHPSMTGEVTITD